MKSEIGNKVGNSEYTVVYDIVLSDTHYIFAVDDSNADTQYLICDMPTGDIFKNYNNSVTTSDYLSGLNEWNYRIATAISNLQQEQLNPDVLNKDSVELLSSNMSIKHKVVVVKPNVLLPEKRYVERQIKFVIGGFGAEGKSGNAVICMSIESNQIERFDRQDILGVLKADKIPSWAKDKIAALQNQYGEQILSSSKKAVKLRA